MSFQKNYCTGFHYEETGLYVTLVAKHHVSFSTNLAATFFHHPIRVNSKYLDAKCCCTEEEIPNLKNHAVQVKAVKL